LPKRDKEKGSKGKDVMNDHDVAKRQGSKTNDSLNSHPSKVRSREGDQRLIQSITESSSQKEESERNSKILFSITLHCSCFEASEEDVSFSRNV
jgi:hypothetical protein